MDYHTADALRVAAHIFFGGLINILIFAVIPYLIARHVFMRIRSKRKSTA